MPDNNSQTQPALLELRTLKKSFSDLTDETQAIRSLFDADMALQLQNIIGESEESVEGNSQTEGEIERLRTLQESYDALNEKYQTMADAWSAMVTNRSSLDGYTLISPYIVNGVGDIYANYTRIKEIRDTTTEQVAIERFFYGCSNLKYAQFTALTTITNMYAFESSGLVEIDCPNLETITNTRAFLSCTSLTTVNLPKLKYTLGGFFSNCTSLGEIELPAVAKLDVNTFQNDTSLKRVSVPQLRSIYNTGVFQNCVNLIDIETGGSFVSNISLYYWSPTNALSSGSSSLVNPGETFASNLEKLLYNIREHIAANLPDRTGLSSFTITFSAAVKAAILADQPTADAFTNKNWIIA